MVQRLKMTTDMEDKFELRYDSDEEVGPFLDALEQEGDQIVDENVVPDEGEEDVTQPSSENDIVEEEEESTMPPLNIDVFIPIEEGEVEKMKVA